MEGGEFHVVLFHHLYLPPISSIFVKAGCLREEKVKINHLLNHRWLAEKDIVASSNLRTAFLS